MEGLPIANEDDKLIIQSLKETIDVLREQNSYYESLIKSLTSNVDSISKSNLAMAESANLIARINSKLTLDLLSQLHPIKK